jgi:hypothetical protein
MWLLSRGEAPPTSRWHVGIYLDAVERPAITTWNDAVDTRFHLDIFSEEWGLFFCHGGKASWIRVTDIAFIHGRDDFRLLEWMPSLDRISVLLRSLEQVHSIKLQRRFAAIETEMPRIEPSVRAWLEAL